MEGEAKELTCCGTSASVLAARSAGVLVYTV